MLWTGNMSKCFTGASLFLFCHALYFLLLHCFTCILGNIVQLKCLSIIVSNISNSSINFRISLILIVCSHTSKQMFLDLILLPCVLCYHYLTYSPYYQHCLLIHLLIHHSSSLLYFAILWTT